MNNKEADKHFTILDIVLGNLLVALVMISIGFKLGEDFGYKKGKVKALDSTIAKQLEEIMKPKEKTCTVEIIRRNGEIHVWTGSYKT